MMDILQMHKNCLDFLLQWQEKNRDFYFIPRKKNNDKKLEKGMYFRGNVKYIALSFWDATDKRKMVYNINWRCDVKGKSWIELSCAETVEREPYIKEIKKLIEAQGKHFDEVEKNKWRWCYPEDIFYIDALRDFVLCEKPVIDKYLSDHTASGILLANKELDDKYVKKLPGYREYLENNQKLKKIDPVIVKPSDYIMTFQHNELSRLMVDYLQRSGYRKIKAEDNHVDISCNNLAGEKVFFELKTAKTVKAAIREAIGQLLEYDHYPNSNRADKLIIVTVCEPEKEDKQYLIWLRKKYQIPIYYQQFDMEKRQLSKEY